PLAAGLGVDNSAGCERVEVRVRPPHGRLDDPVQARKARPPWYSQPAPDRRVGLQERDLELIHHGRSLPDRVGIGTLGSGPRRWNLVGLKAEAAFAVGLHALDPRR